MLQGRSEILHDVLKSSFPLFFSPAHSENACSYYKCVVLKVKWINHTKKNTSYSSIQLHAAFCWSFNKLFFFNYFGLFMVEIV